MVNRLFCYRIYPEFAYPRALAGHQDPIGVTEWKTQIARALPEEF